MIVNAILPRFLRNLSMNKKVHSGTVFAKKSNGLVLILIWVVVFGLWGGALNETAGQCTITRTSAVGTDNQTLCTLNTPITNITYSTVNATGATFSGLPAGVVGNWASNTVTISGTPTGRGIYNYTVTLTGPCGLVTATGSIKIRPSITITGTVLSSTLTCGTAPLLTACADTLFIGDGINPATLNLNASLNLTCLGPIVFIIRNNGTVTFTNNNVDLKLGAGSRFFINSGGNLPSTNPCDATKTITIGSVVYSSCNGQGQGNPPSFNQLECGSYIVASAAVTSPILCSGGSGTVTITVSSGGKAPFQYSLNGSSFQSSNVFTITAGTGYTWVVQDDSKPKACFNTGSVNVSEPAPLTITTAATATSICFSSSIQTTNLTYSATTGAPTTYSITWNPSPANSFVPVTNTALPAGQISISVPANTAPGTYAGTITVKNAAGCSSSGTAFSVTIIPLPSTSAIYHR